MAKAAVNLPKDKSEVEELEKKTEVEELKERLEILEQMLSSKASEGSDKSESDEKLTGDSYIQVLSLTPYTLSLSTLGSGRGKVFKFKKFGQIKGILYSDLVSIIESNQAFLEKGYFYILDKRVVRKHGLDELYETILNKEKLEQVFMCESNSVIELYKAANDRQRNFANQVIVGKLRADEYLDLNIVSAISRIAGVDLIAKAEEFKELFEQEQPKK